MYKSTVRERVDEDQSEQMSVGMLRAELVCRAEPIMPNVRIAQVDQVEQLPSDEADYREMYRAEQLCRAGIIVPNDDDAQVEADCGVVN